MEPLALRPGCQSRLQPPRDLPGDARTHGAPPAPRTPRLPGLARTHALSLAAREPLTVWRVPGPAAAPWGQTLRVPIRGFRLGDAAAGRRWARARAGTRAGLRGEWNKEERPQSHAARGGWEPLSFQLCNKRVEILNGEAADFICLRKSSGGTPIWLL